MMEILFRGVDIHHNTITGLTLNIWRTGSLIEYDSGQAAIVAVADRYGRGVFLNEVIPETVGQNIGIDDKNGKKIFVGDIVVVKDGLSYGDNYECVGTIIVEDLRTIGPGDYEDVEVIGNITDDPELWEASV